MRAIDADALKDVIQQHDYPLADRLNSIDTGMFTLGIFQAIDEQPTLSPDDVRSVVHCGECSHADKDLPGAIYCTMWDAWEVPEDGFCYKGAKMEVSDE
jgi:hypothetical protein